MFNRHNRKVRALFVVADIILAALAFEAAYQTRVVLQLERIFFLTAPVKALLLGATVVAWPLLGRWLGIHDKLDSARPLVLLGDAFRQCFLGVTCIVLLEFALRLDLSRPFLALLAIYSFLFLVLFRLNARSIAGLMRREFGALHYVMVVGLSERARKIAAALEESEKYGVRLIGFLRDRPETPDDPPKPPQPVYPMEELPELLQKKVIDEIIFAVDSNRIAELEEVFLLCDEEGVRTCISVDFFPHVNSDVYLDRLGSTPLLAFAAAPHDEVRLLLKRVLDFVLALAAFLLVLPLMLLVAALIRVTSRGPVIFRQERCGLNGRRFVCYKFRSMVENAEELKESVRHLNARDTAFKIPNDPRLTPVGRFLRKFSIDEWPQLWNILKGDMSLVGPRPAVPEEVEQYKRWQRRRLRMRPGLTCLWAIAGRDSVDFETWMKMDMAYIDSWSLALDWKIMLRTIPRVLSGKGAH